MLNFSPSADAQLALSTARAAYALARIDRGLNRDDGEPESDADHAVMVGWLACALAARWYPERLDVGLVAQLAIAHDAIEIICGDTYAVSLDDAGRAAKQARERAALGTLAAMSLEWLGERNAWYEDKLLPEACFVWAVDKIVTKVACIIDDCAEVKRRTTPDERQAFLDYERLAMECIAGDFPELIKLYEELVSVVWSACGT